MRATVFFSLMGGLLVVLALIAGIRGLDQGGEQGGFSGAGGASPVAVAEVRPRTLVDVVEALGTARANESIVISTQVTDVVSRVAFDSGDVVSEGQVLVELADAEEAADLAEARAAGVEAEQEFARFTDLRERGVAAQSQVDEARSLVDQARSRVRSLEARMADRIVRAPFAGVIGLRNTSVGALVRPGDEIATLDDISVIKLDFTVPEGFLGVLERGAAIEAIAAAYSDATFDGIVTHIDSRVDPVTRTVVVRAEIDNADGRLLPGMLMLVELRRNEREAPVVPELAVLREGETVFVYVVAEEDGALKAARRPVVTGTRRDGEVEILEGLQLGERVVAEGVHRIRAGATVRVVDDADMPATSARGGPRSPSAGSGSGR